VRWLALLINAVAIVAVRLRLLRVSSDRLEDVAEACQSAGNTDEAGWPPRLERKAFRALSHGFEAAAQAARCRELVRAVGQERAVRLLQNGCRTTWEDEPEGGDVRVRAHRPSPEAQARAMETHPDRQRGHVVVSVCGALFGTALTLAAGGLGVAFWEIELPWHAAGMAAAGCGAAYGVWLLVKNV
jgi:hypothetical protein